MKNRTKIAGCCSNSAQFSNSAQVFFNQIGVSFFVSWKINGKELVFAFYMFKVKNSISSV